MTGRRGRLARLEEKARGQEDVAPIVIWWADADAALWREGTGSPGEAEGQAEAMTPEEAAEVRAREGHTLRLTGLPTRKGTP